MAGATLEDEADFICAGVKKGKQTYLQRQERFFEGDGGDVGVAEGGTFHRRVSRQRTMRTRESEEGFEAVVRRGETHVGNESVLAGRGDEREDRAEKMVERERWKVGKGTCNHAKTSVHENGISNKNHAATTILHLLHSLSHHSMPRSECFDASFVLQSLPGVNSLYFYGMEAASQAGLVAAPKLQVSR
ncbi:hypothetical protein BJ508DRAFT_307899 [Ascobolus immersus RN42]|uniref:Uncharacterized protein n=1 Tax=Ascobolus immersus RN42 TaxID=1160509 RepID=A0A3N4I1Y6_ASCIM|nr:hypothetical protein BJ508DRAFT_307899 [Ascobolus immersus RN42]